MGLSHEAPARGVDMLDESFYVAHPYCRLGVPCGICGNRVYFVRGAGFQRKCRCRQPAPWEREGSMKRPVRIVEGGGGVKLTDEQAGSLKRLSMALWEFLTHTAYDDGATRQTGTMLVMVDDACLKAWLNDRDCGHTTWVSGDSWDELLKAAGKAINDPGTHWRPVTDRKPKKGGARG